MIKIGDATLLQGEALTLLRTLGDETVDAILTDPPYSSGSVHASGRQRSPAEKYQQTGTKRKYPELLGDNRDQRSFIVWATLWLAECFRAARPGAVCMVFTDWRQLPAITDALQAAGWLWRGVVPWDKPTSRPSRGEFRKQCEYVVYAVKGGFHRVHDRCLPGVYRHKVIASRKRHLTEKPVPLLIDLLEITPSDATVLDPFMGSATTGAACMATGRKFLGIELSEDYFKVSCARLREMINETAPAHARA